MLELVSMECGSTRDGERAETMLAAPLQSGPAKVVLILRPAVRADLMDVGLPPHSGQKGMRLCLGKTFYVCHRGCQGFLFEPEICCQFATTVFMNSGQSTPKKQFCKPKEKALERGFQSNYCATKTHGIGGEMQHEATLGDEFHSLHVP